MSHVDPRRYDLAAVPNTYDNWHMQERSDGEYMRFADHQAAITAAEAENAKLRTRLLSAAGDDLCRLTQEEIKAYTSGEVQIPPKSEFISSCERFHDQIASTAGVLGNCLTMAQLIAENTAAEATIAGLREELSQHANWTANKDALHIELDAAGAPPCKGESCRISVRVRWLMAQLTVAQEHNFADKARAALARPHHEP